MEEYDEAEERAERISEVKQMLADRLNDLGAVADPFMAQDDVYVSWYLNDLMEFCRDYRSEIEELG